MKRDDIKAFLYEYRAVCEKYGVYIQACGCCDSPFLSDLSSEYAEGIDEIIRHLRVEWEKRNEDDS